MLRDGYGGESWTPRVSADGVVRVLAIVLCAVFVVQSLTESVLGSGWVREVFALSREGLLAFRVWQPVTYVFLHGDLWHLLMNLMGLVFFGRDLEENLGSRRFLLLFLGCGILGGLGWLVLSALSGGAACVGASGAVYGLLGAFAALFPNRVVTLLVFFVLPVSLSARMLACVAGGMALYSSVTSAGGGIAHAAHLAGGVAGYLYGLRVLQVYGPYGLAARQDGGLGLRGMWVDAVAWWRRRKWRVVAGAGGAGVVRSGPEEVDRILEKIVAQGMGSLTEREKKVLLQASEAGK